VTPLPTICAGCGRTPALGLALLQGFRWCHPDDLNKRDCYSIEIQRRAALDAHPLYEMIPEPQA